MLMLVTYNYLHDTSPKNGDGGDWYTGLWMGHDDSEPAEIICNLYVQITSGQHKSMNFLNCYTKRGVQEPSLIQKIKSSLHNELPKDVSTFECPI